MSSFTGSNGYNIVCISWGSENAIAKQFLNIVNDLSTTWKYD